MKSWIKFFTIICLFIVSQLNILVAQNDSMERAFVIRTDAFTTYASEEIERGLSVDKAALSTAVFEFLKKDFIGLSVAEFENPELSFKAELENNHKRKIRFAVKFFSENLTASRCDLPASSKVISPKELLTSILSYITTALPNDTPYVIIYLSSNGDIGTFGILFS